MRTISPRALVFNTREGPVTIAIDRRRVQPVATAVAAVLALLFGACRLSPVAGLAVLPSRAAVRRAGSRARQGRRLLRLPAALPGCAPRLSLRPRRAVRRHRRCGVCDCRRHRLRSEPRCANRASGEAPPGRARRRAAPRARVRRVSRRAQAADDAGRHHPWRRQRRRGRPDPGAAGADGRRARRRRAGAVSDGRCVLVADHRAPPRCTSS